MKVVGAIVEYNPMHSGHVHHICETRRDVMADFCVGIMSGNFTQRGDAAIMDKWKRAEIAVKNGLDLIIELPFAFAANSAEYFAKGAVSILESIGCVDVLSFGSEEGALEKLVLVADVIKTEPPEYRRVLKKYLKEGFTFPQARERAIDVSMGRVFSSLLRQPNNILAIEYLKACRSMEPYTMKRAGDYHKDDICGELTSSTAIREGVRGKSGCELTTQIENMFAGGVMPRDTAEGLKDSMNIGSMEEIFRIARWEFIRKTGEGLGKIFSMNEGLENRLNAYSKSENDYRDFAKKVRSKRYTKATLDRIILHTAMGFEKMDVFKENLYARVLAANKNGRKLIRHIEKENTSNIPIITKLERGMEEEYKLLNYDVLATCLYNIINERDLYSEGDYVRKPYIEI